MRNLTIIIAVSSFAALLPVRSAAESLFLCGRVYQNRPCPASSRSSHKVTGNYSKVITASPAADDMDRASIDIGMLAGREADKSRLERPANRREPLVTKSEQQSELERSVQALADQASDLRRNSPSLKRTEGAIRAQAQINRTRVNLDIVCSGLNKPVQIEDQCRRAQGDLQEAFHGAQ